MLLTKRSIDLTGKRFGSLLAISPSHKGSNNLLYWNFKCDCGKLHIARGNTVKYESKRGADNLPSCGCVELSNKTKHGYRTVKDTHPTYKIYAAIMGRCYNEDNQVYLWYGKVGVTVCSEWKNNPKAFVEWAINNGWKSGLHIDKDTLSDKLNIFPHIYSPKTCQWITAKENVGYATNRDNFGKHPNIKLSHEDVSKIRRLYHSGEMTNMSQLARDFGLLSPSSIHRLVK